MRTIIVDDEELARNELAFLLEQVGGVEVVGRAANGVDAIKLIEALSPDLVLLDIQMPGLTGFEVAQQLVEQKIESRIVFVTAFDQYAIEAFKVNAVDYLLKPVEPARLEQTIQRVRHSMTTDHKPQQSQVDADFERMAQRISERQSLREQLAVKVGERFLLVNTGDVIYASLADEAISVVTQSLVGNSNCRTLDELQGHLDPAVFWRVHRSHLVNIRKIREIIPWFSRNLILKMKDAKATEIPVSRSQTKRLREYLNL